MERDTLEVGRGVSVEFGRERIAENWITQIEDDCIDRTFLLLQM